MLVAARSFKFINRTKTSNEKQILLQVLWYVYSRIVPTGATSRSLFEYGSSIVL